jgi:CBS domain-containing protein
MVERGVTSALVTDGDVLVGIFTSTDALRVLADL